MTTKRRKNNMGKTTDGLKILKRRMAKDPKWQCIYEEEKLKDQIARQVCSLRMKAGLSQADLGKLLHTSQSAIARLENADYEGNSVEKLQQVARVLKCRLEIKFVKKDSLRLEFTAPL
jgi:ribosome-binding protein aMBF1 (putative translation factor)